MLMNNPVDHSWQQVGTTTFVDDLARKQICKGQQRQGEQQRPEQVWERINNKLDEALARKGFVQNLGKQVTVPNMRTRDDNRRLYKPGVLASTVAPEARYLGGIHEAQGGVGVEIRRRKKAAKAGWCQLRGMWHKNRPFAAKRLAFIAKVQGGLLSGLESYVLARTHYRALDAVVLRMVRSLMMGKAANKTGPHVKAMKSRQVWKWIRMVPAELELRVRRLKWLQAISKDVQLNAQLIAAVWGGEYA
jgi:hypothetical protein